MDKPVNGHVKYIMQWLLDERIILLMGALSFVVGGIYMIHIKAGEAHITYMFSLAGSLIGALIRGIIGTVSKGE